MDYERQSFNGIEVLYTPEIDGGGSGYGQDYIPFIQSHYPRQNRVFEWCAGPGFIGFSILAHDLCDTLCLADVNPAAVEAARQTIAANGLEDRVTVYQSDGLADIPATERWDLVVANPPHSGTDEKIERINRTTLVYQDVDWKLHRDFYGNVGRFLAPGGELLIQENSMFSSVEVFRPMIEGSGFEIVESPECETTYKKCYYYIRSRVRGPARS